MTSRSRKQVLALWICGLWLVQGNQSETTGSRSLKNGPGESRIVGGERAPINRYPYSVSLQSFDSSHFCGASLIAPDLVLSAAHCKDSVQQVLINPHRISRPIAESETFAPLQELPHPLYRSVTANDHDIMIIKMNGNSTLPPIRVNDDDSVPVPSELLVGLGWGTLSSGGSAPDSLQHVNLTYVDNEQCVQTTVEDGNFGGGYVGEITDDMMCALEPGKDTCQGDSGGPLVVAGADGVSDVQVGIVSWGFGCADPNFPGVYARTSEEWIWIRATVCNNSDDPPAQYRCDEGGATFSPRPTSTPTAPTASPAPSGQVTEVLVTLVLDSFVSETGFQIKDQDGDVVFGIEPESYSSKEPGATVSEIVSLNAGAGFTLTLIDSFGDGFSGQAVVYLGIQEDMSKVLAYYDGSTTSFAREYDVPFGTGEDFIIAVFPSQAPAFPSPLPSLEPSAPTFSPAPTSPEALILFRITLDAWPSETGWRLETADGDVVKEVRTGTYSVGSANVRDEFTLRHDEMYNLVILDSFGDGFQGEVVVYFESEKETAILAYFSSTLAIFSTELSLPFLASIEGVVQVFPTMSPTTPTGSPSAAPSAPTISPAPSSKDVEIYLTFITDAFPLESGYVVSNNVGETIAEVEAGSFEEPFLAYNQTIVVSENEDFMFTITDNYGDGFDGTAIAYFGDEPDVGKVIMFYGSEEAFEAGGYVSYNLNFRSSVDATIPIFPTSAPTLPTAAPSGAPSAPTISPAPSDSEVAIFVVVTLDLFPTETGYSISQAGEVVHEVPPGTHGLDTSEGQSEIVFLKRDQEFNFTILDSYGDGFDGTVAVYLGEEADNSMLLAYYEGPEGRFSEFEVGFGTSGSSIIQIFPTMAPSAPTGAPSDEPSAPTISPSPTIGKVNVSIVIELDSYPAETGWRIETLDGTVIEEVEAGTYTDMRPNFDDDYTDDTVLEEARAKEKLKKEKQANVRTGMFVPTQIVTLQGGVQYTFVVTDAFGDGFRGQATVYLGEMPAEDQVLVHHDGTSSGGFSEPYSFVTTPEGVLDIAVQPPREFEVNVALEFPSILLVWQLQDENGNILAEKTPLGPLISPVTVSFVHAGRPKMLVFTIENQFQAELTGSYSISTDNEIIAMGDHDLGVSRVHYFEVGATAGNIPVTAFAKSAKLINYDLEPTLSWDFSQVGEVGFVETYFLKAFEFDGSMATTNFIPQGELYNGRFYADSNVIDSYHMTVGSADPFQGHMLLANQQLYTFVAVENYTTPLLGDDYLMLEINFGASDPANIGWLLHAGAVHTSQVPVAPTDAPVTAPPSATVTTAPVTAAPSSRVYILTGAETESRKSPQEDSQLYTFGPETPYFSNLTLTSDLIPLPPILANGAQEFSFEIYNSEGYGLDGVGEYKLYDGDRLIAIGSIEDGYSDRHVFTINGPVVEVAPTDPPTDTSNSTPDSNRTLTPAPSPSSGGVERKAVMSFSSIALSLLSIAFTV